MFNTKVSRYIPNRSNRYRGGINTSAYNAYMRRGFRNFFTMGSRNRSFGRTTTRARRSRKSRPRYYQKKNMTRKRATVGLPPLEMKHISLNNTSAQWTAATASTWSFRGTPHYIAKGTDNHTRTSNSIKFLPFSYNFWIKQPVDTQYRYRVLVVKSLKNFVDNADIDPSHILQDTTNIPIMLTSSYLEQEDRTFEFKVLLDKTYNINSYGSNKSLRNIRIKIPTCNIKYDPDITTGDHSINSISVLILTEATSLSVGTHYFTRDYTMKFIDM